MTPDAEDSDANRLMDAIYEASGASDTLNPVAMNVVEKARNLVRYYDEKGMKGLVYAQAAALLRAVEALGFVANLDCGDNSCRFVLPEEKKGMRTNGGCRCLRDEGYDRGMRGPHADFHVLKLRARECLVSLGVAD